MNCVSRLLRNWKSKLLLLFICQIFSLLVISLVLRYYQVDFLQLQREVKDLDDFNVDEPTELVLNRTDIIKDQNETFDFPEEKFSHEFAESFEEVMSEGTLDCGQKCVKKDFFTGLFGRKYSERCKVQDKIKAGERVPVPKRIKIMTRPIDGLPTVCTYPIFTKYIPESDSLVVECPIGSTLKIYAIEDNLPNLDGVNIGKGKDDPAAEPGSIYCSIEGKCKVNELVTNNVKPRIFTLEDTNQMTVQLNNEGVLMVDCGEGRVNFVFASKFLEKDLEKLKNAVQEKKYLKPPPDILLILSDTTNRFGFAESIKSTRKLLDEIRNDKNSGFQIFDFMYFNSVEQKTPGNVPPLLAGAPAFNMKTFNAPFPRKHVYSSLFTDMKEHGYHTQKTGKSDRLAFQSESETKRIYDHYPHRMGLGYNFGIYAKKTYTGEGKSITKKFYKYGSASISEHCLAGLTPIMRYTDQIINSVKVRDAIAPKIPQFIYMHELENHNGNYHGGQVLDIALVRFLKELDMTKTILILVGDHGYWAGSYASNKYYKSTFYNPPGLMMVPEYLLTNEIFSNLKNNEKLTVSVYDFHRTIKELPYFLQQGRHFKQLEEKWAPGGVAPGSVNLITEKVSRYRTCKDMNIPSSMCTCETMKSRTGTQDEVTILKKEFIEYVSSTVSHEHCWILEEWMLEVVDVLICEEENYFECKINIVLDDDRFIAKEKFIWKAIGDVVGKNPEDKKGKFVFENLDFRVVSRTSIYDLELCRESIIEKREKEVCICLEGNDLSLPGL